MKKTPFLACTLAAVLMLAGCQESKVEEKVEAETKTEDTVETKAPSMSKEEVTTLITTALETVKSVLDKAWDENNWNSSAEADLNVFKEMLKDVTSEEFVDTQIKNMMDNRYYEGTDIRYIPFGIRADLKLDIKQEEKTLRATSFIPEDYFNGGYTYTFIFDYINEKWILRGWEEDVPNLDLSIEESKDIIETTTGFTGIVFKEEKQTDEGKVYVFSPNETVTIVFNPNTTAFTEEASKVKEEEEPVENNNTTSDSNTTVATRDSIINGFKKTSSPSVGLNNREYYLNYIKEVNAYIDSFGITDKTTDDYLPYAEAYFDLIDDVFYEMVDLIHNNLTGDKMEQYREEQAEWGNALDQGVRNVGPSELDFYEFESRMKEERCIEIANKYMN